MNCDPRRDFTSEFQEEWFSEDTDGRREARLQAMASQGDRWAIMRFLARVDS